MLIIDNVKIEKKEYVDEQKNVIPYFDCTGDYKGQPVKFSVKKSSKDLVDFLYCTFGDDE